MHYEFDRNTAHAKELQSGWVSERGRRVRPPAPARPSSAAALPAPRTPRWLCSWLCRAGCAALAVQLAVPLAVPLAVQPVMQPAVRPPPMSPGPWAKPVQLAVPPSSSVLFTNFHEFQKRISRSFNILHDA